MRRSPSIGGPAGLRRPAPLLLAAALLAACGGEPAPPARTLTSLPEPVLDAMLARHVTVDLRFDAGTLSDPDRGIVRRLVQAGEFLDRAYWEQAAPGAAAIRQKMEDSTRPIERKLGRLLRLNAGPFDRLLDGEPFLGTSLRPPGAGFYPEFASREEIEEWVARHPGSAAEILSPRTVVRREGGRLAAVPFREAYREWLDPAVALLQEAASATTDPALMSVLAGRGESLIADDPLPAELDWLSLEGRPFEFALGAYDFTDDRLLGAKGAFVASVGVIDPAATVRFEGYAADLPALEARLPLDEALRRRALPPLRVTALWELYRGGALGYGYQEGSLLLPPDPRAQEAGGAKLLFWPDLIAARARLLLLPAAQIAVAELQRPAVGMDAAAEIAALHGLGHALGPRFAATPGGPVPVAESLREEHAWVEEAKAEAVGMDALPWMIEQGRLPEANLRGDATALLASLLAAARHGASVPAGQAAIVALNWHREHGGLTHDRPSGTWAVDFDRLEESLRALARELLEIQARGDRQRAARLRRDYGRADPDLRATLARLDAIPASLTQAIEVRWP